MNPKQKLDFGSVALDVASTIDDAVSRSEAFQRQKSQQARQQAPRVTANSTDNSTDRNTDKDAAETRSGQGGEATPSGPAVRRPRAASGPQKSPAAPLRPVAQDPWVNTTFKVKNSKRERLHRLHLERQLAGLTPYSKQDFLDEALDYVLAKYEPRSAGRKSSE